MKRLALIVVCLSLIGCRVHDGRDGRNGDRGATGPTGPTGSAGTTPFSFGGSFTYPTQGVAQTVPGLSLDNGDVLNVYIQWVTPATGGQGYIQIGNQAGIGQNAFFTVIGNQVTISAVIGAGTTVDWFINGVKKGA